ncbi:MAG: BamA/TamA family outer membrane protein [Candidatus Eisenbacteria sp.]|nr:BamA/TamA family outer membrane protein [Candidatus Eisenbacteria bacterium]
MFRYRDDDYEQVCISGSFNGWRREPMQLDADEGVWSIHLRLEPGRHLYQFVVEDLDETWEAIDPDNPATERLKDRGWASVVVIDDDGDVSRREYYAGWRMDCELERKYDHKGPGVRYQRADGLFLCFSPVHLSDGRFEPSVQGMVGYGFKSDEWSASIMLLQPLAADNKWLFKAFACMQTDFTDQTGIGTNENSLAAILFKEDFRDYYRHEGAELGLIYSGLNWLRLEGGFRVGDYSSMKRNADWSISEGDFLPNPAIDPGTMRSLFAQLTLGRKLNHLDVTYEYSGEDLLGGAYEFEQLTAQYRGRLRMGSRRYLDFRVKTGTSLSGRLPIQRRYVVGGLGTVRGYEYQSLLVPDPAIERAPQGREMFGGERMMIANAEYVFPIRGHLDLVFFFDTGMAWEDQDASMDLDDWQSSAGIGFQLGDDALRLNLIQCLDGEDRDIVVQLRINRMF